VDEAAGALLPLGVEIGDARRAGPADDSRGRSLALGDRAYRGHRGPHVQWIPARRNPRATTRFRCGHRVTSAGTERFRLRRRYRRR